MAREPEEPQDVEPEDLLDEIEGRVQRNLPRPELAHFLDMDVRVETREIFIQDEIDGDFGGWFTKVYRYFLALDPKAPITVWLNTEGGDEEGMLVFYDLVTTSPAKVTIVAAGSVSSAGVLMLACGHNRLVTENCTLMSHESQGGEGGGLRHSAAKERRKYEDWMHDRWFELMARCCTRNNPESDKAFWKRVTERKAEFWRFGAQEIIDTGIADAFYEYKLLPIPARRR